MSTTRRLRLRHAGFAVALVLAACLAFVALRSFATHRAPPPAARPAWSLAVLGDSDSHSYHDRLLIPDDAFKRGGSLRATTWQWTETLAQLRGGQLDLGEWGAWGQPAHLAEALLRLGRAGRAPRKQDYRYNFAVSGAECGDLMDGPWHQAPQLRALMDEDPARWRTGIVAIRIGINTLGGVEQLDRYAREGDSPAVRAQMLTCAQAVRQAVGLIRAGHPQTRFVLVGIADNADWQPNFERWTALEDRRNIAAALDVYDDALRALAAGDARIAFFDDRAWFRRHWGARDAQGRPAYGAVNLGGRASVHQTRGDAPVHAVLADGHAGSVWNALWASDFVALIDAAFGAGVEPLAPGEIARFVDPDGRYGLRPDPSAPGS